MFQENVSLKQYSNYKIGGPARYFVSVKTTEEVIAAAKEAHNIGASVFILGGGTNLLISDAGFRGLVMRAEFSTLQIEGGTKVRVGAGVLMKELVQFCIDNSLAGIEWAGGLPGTVGGAVWGNAGAFKGEMKDSVIEVTSVDTRLPAPEVPPDMQGKSLRTGAGNGGQVDLTHSAGSGQVPKVIMRNNTQCQFGYRGSIFKINTGKGVSEVITEIVFQFVKGDKELLRVAAQEKIDYRIAKQPLDYPNIGSIFKNTDVKFVPEATLKRFEAKIKHDPFPVLPTAVLNDAAGLKGRIAGGAMISPKHPNFIINATGSATAADVKELMALVRSEIKKQFGVELEQEVIEI